MCGILFSCTDQKVVDSSDCHYADLRRRGPDSFKTIQRQILGKRPNSAREANSCISYLNFTATVLSLRGNLVVEQPLEDAQSGSILCWNGEAWKVNGTTIVGNDAVVIMNLLVEAVGSHYTSSMKDKAPDGATTEAVLDVMSSISGPFAFLFFDAKSQMIFYGRDPLGRRSLLHNIATDGALSLSSIYQHTGTDGWTEVEAGCIYRFDLGNSPSTINNPNSPEQIFHSVQIPQGSPCIFALTKLQRPSFPGLNRASRRSDLSTLDIDSATISELAERLQSSLSLRVQNIPYPCSTTETSTCIAVLFSGGLDCTLLARLIHDILPLEYDIDLLNVAFENPRVVRAANTNASLSSASAYSMCPDRITGLSSHAELLRVCPGRKWRLVCIDIPYSETLTHRPHIVRLMHPHNTEMDLSIACALYFAARGIGTIVGQNADNRNIYTTTARVLLSGLGADELFAGYTRHATAFDRNGYQGLTDELGLDFNRVGKRNLGRDDRVISHWGREARYPYLDENLVSWVLELPVWKKCGFGETQPVEDKELNFKPPYFEPGKKALRLLAWKLGMETAATEKKRAIQFGARTAKMEAGKSKGTQELFMALTVPE
ncbi:hypothetical protein MMC31_008059 [Peltigera leucophlebia]|nr:hypothetical protein [Peltigera leucophlebia]